MNLYPINPREDGVTHINVYSQGATELGRLLSNFAYTPFELEGDGRFASVEGFWYWLSTRDDRLRSLYGFAAKKLGRALRGQDWLDAPVFRDRIRAALDAKLAAHPSIKQKLVASTLPFLHYYVFNGSVRDETARCQRMLDHFHRIRSTRSTSPV